MTAVSFNGVIGFRKRHSDEDISPGDFAFFIGSSQPVKILEDVDKELEGFDDTDKVEEFSVSLDFEKELVAVAFFLWFETVDNFDNAKEVVDSSVCLDFEDMLVVAVFF